MENHNIVTLALMRVPLPTWQVFMDEMVTRFQDTPRARVIAERFFEHTQMVGVVIPHRRQMREWFTQRWEWVRNGQLGPEPAQPVFVALNQIPHAAPRAAVPELQRLAGDAQNVHTTAVTRQTNTSVDKLLAVNVPGTQQTERQLTLAWFSLPKPPGFNEYLRVATDVNRWFLTNTCRAENDNLYRKLLRGLVALIERQEGETRTELYKRLWEECKEATGMCCEGHISRLCNVMVGFDESFQPPVSLGEILQSKMSAIASLMDVPTETKITHANAVFDELGVPAAERVAWLEAF